jgi:hypothetical protein
MCSIAYLRCHLRNIESIDGEIVQAPLYARLKRLLYVINQSLVGDHILYIYIISIYRYIYI